jgi:redox-sensitive bicupin YhaK (pirin superfamily)
VICEESRAGCLSGSEGPLCGDGFPVRSLFSYDQLGRHISPFLLLDYAAPTMFSPAVRPRGAGEHPHRGFETVTIVYRGEVAHRDSVGNSGVIGPGDVQWMTAAAGILHDEFHSSAFMRRGGELEMAQLWVIAAGTDSTILVLSGVPIAEPIAGYGPFVMNTRQEIETAMNDFRLGKFGRMPPLEVAADRAGAGAI